MAYSDLKKFTRIAYKQLHPNGSLPLILGTAFDAKKATAVE
jgi:hypothetical protein